MFCHNCGKQIPDGSRFCHYCGAPQAAAGSAPQPERPVQQRPVQQRPAWPPQAERPQYAPPAQPVYAPDPVPQRPVKKRRSHAGAIFGIVFAVLALVAVVVFVVPRVRAWLAIKDRVNADEWFYEPGDPSLYALSPAPQSGTLGADWNSFSFQLNGHVLTLPCSWDDLHSAGIVLETADESYPVDPNSELSTDCKAGPLRLEVKWINGADEKRPIGECLAAAIWIDGKDKGLTETELLIPGGFPLLSATPRDLYDTYSGGYIQQTEQDGEIVRLTWGKDGNWLSYTFTTEETDDHLISFAMQRCSLPAEEDTQTPPTDEEAPGQREINAAYEELLAPSGYEEYPTLVAAVQSGLNDPRMERFARREADGGYTLHDYGGEGDTVVNYAETILVDLSGLSEDEQEAASDRIFSETEQLNDLEFVRVDYLADDDLGILTFICTGIDREENWRELYSRGIFDEEGPYSLSGIRQKELAQGYIPYYLDDDTPAPQVEANPEYMRILSDAHILHTPLLFGMDLESFAKMDEDGNLICRDYGYRDDLVLTYIETWYYTAVSEGGEEYLQALWDFVDGEAERYSAVACAAVTGSYDEASDSFAVKYEFTGLDDLANCQALHDMGVTTGAGELISLSKCEDSALAEGFVKK